MDLDAIIDGIISFAETFTTVFDVFGTILSVFEKIISFVLNIFG